MQLDEVAKILGINEQEVENAFNQARNELADDGLMNRREGWPPGMLPPDGSPPEGLPEGMERSAGRRFPEGMEPPVRGRLPEPLLARMAEILNIDQQELADAFTQVQGTGSNE